MAFFKFRWPGRKGQDDTKSPRASRRVPQAESAGVLRRRARHRLIGATVLVALGVVGFPMLFDTQPRPIPVDIPISIPDRNKTPALVLPENRAAASSEAAKTPAAPASSAGLDAGEEIVASSPVTAPTSKPQVPKPADTAATDIRKEPATPKPETPHVATAPKREIKPEPKPEPKPETRPLPAAVARADDAARARALLEGRSPAPPPTAVVAESASAAASDAARFVVQVGAFGDTAKAQEARAKLARSGLKTYVQSIDTKDGKRHRVRVGPFANRAEADQAAARIRGLDLPASILAL